MSADLPGTYAETQDLGGKSVAAVMAAHGFTFSFGLGHTNDTVAECTKHKLGCLVSKADIPTAAGAPLPPAAVWGYNIGDEPGTAQFAAMGADFGRIRQFAPSKMGFANMLETCALPPAPPSASLWFGSLRPLGLTLPIGGRVADCPALSLNANPPAPPGTALNWSLTYEGYAEQYVAQVRPSILCMDYYP